MWRSFDGIFLSTLTPKGEQFWIALLYFCCKFKVEKRIQKARVLHEALRLTSLSFLESELMRHDITDLIDDRFWDADLLADRA